MYIPESALINPPSNFEYPTIAKTPVKLAQTLEKLNSITLSPSNSSTFSPYSGDRMLPRLSPLAQITAGSQSTPNTMNNMNVIGGEPAKIPSLNRMDVVKMKTDQKLFGGTTSGQTEPEFDKENGPNNVPISTLASKSGKVLRTGSVLEELYNRLENGLAKRRTFNFTESALATENMDSLPHPDVYITKWIDYSNKYGLGYQLKDGSVGVYFNDATSIILSRNDQYDLLIKQL
jgi:hypothetical protein